ncbi:hypothetical protein NSPZN2_50282 [Nitrospira defluvii]|uniref:Uncharacterized protein n=1 Tax=Nitrospira defluvii TaxID=330214 RepID=A0ABM8S574_9BACT|nr:hypothetical protein NSPZN2_50282 [Nitrospira defluvii]
MEGGAQDETVGVAQDVITHPTVRDWLCQRRLRGSMRQALDSTRLNYFLARLKRTARVEQCDGSASIAVPASLWRGRGFNSCPPERAWEMTAYPLRLLRPS